MAVSSSFFTLVTVGLLRRAGSSRAQPADLQVGPRDKAFPTFFVPDLVSSTCEGKDGCQLTSITATAAASTTRSIAAPYALVEFYAPWCAQCQAFAPAMELLGNAFNRGNSPVQVARVNCAAQRPVCRAWGVSGLPTLLAGATVEFALSDGRTDAADVEPLELTQPDSAQAIANWIADKWSFTQKLAEPNAFNTELATLIRSRLGDGSTSTGGSASNYRQQVDHDIELALVKAVQTMLLDLEHVRRKADKAAAVWPAVVADTHVEKLQANAGPPQLIERCEPPPAYKELWTAARAFAQLLGQLPERHRHCRESVSAVELFIEGVRYPVVRPGVAGAHPGQGRASTDVFLRAWRPCGHLIQSYDSDWNACSGTFGFQRGWPCGLWLLLHSATMGLAEMDGSIAAERGRGESVPTAVAVSHAKNGPAAGIVAIRGFVERFFDCVKCRRDFVEMAQGAETTVSTGRDVMLWLWRSHNTVTSRLLKDQERNGGENPFEHDAAHPRQLWPVVGDDSTAQPTERRSVVERTQMMMQRLSH